MHLNQAYVTTLPPLQKGRLVSTLSKEYNTPLGIMSLEQYVTSGKYIRKEINEIPAVKYNRRKWNNMDYREQAAYQKRMDEKKTCYSVVTEDEIYDKPPRKPTHFSRRMKGDGTC